RFSRDWSSDVCSSDLHARTLAARRRHRQWRLPAAPAASGDRMPAMADAPISRRIQRVLEIGAPLFALFERTERLVRELGADACELGRASWRERRRLGE